MSRFVIHTTVSVMVDTAENVDLIKEKLETCNDELGGIVHIEHYKSRERAGGEVHLDFELDIDTDTSEAVANLWEYFKALGSVKEA